MERDEQIEERDELEQIISDATKDYENLCEECFELGEYNPFDFCGYLVDDILRAGYRKQSEGEWIVCGMFDDFLKCSCCGDKHPWQTAIEFKYCPHCGAKMKIV